VFATTLLAGCNALFSLEQTLPDSVDPDHDGFSDADGDDNCPGIENPEQEDTNNDGIGDACSTFCTSRCTDEATCDCEDFDTSTELPADWFFDEYGGGMPTVQTEFATSTPRGLRLHAPGSPSGMPFTQKAKLVRYFQSDRRHVHFEYTWRLSAFGGAALDQFLNYQFASINLNDLDQNPFGNVTIGNILDNPGSPTDVWIVGIQFPTARSMAISMPVPVNQWVHVVWDVVFANDASGSVKLSFDGVTVFEMTGPTASPNSGVAQIGGKAGVELLQSCQINNCGVTKPTVSQNLAHDDLVVELLP